LTSQLGQDLNKILSEAARLPLKSTDLTNDTQRDDRVTQLSLAIKQLVRRRTANESVLEKAMRAINAALRADNTKCQELLTLTLRVDEFVQNILQANLQPALKTRHESPSSNVTDDITKVCKSQPSQSSQQTQLLPVSTLEQPTAEVEKRANAAFVNFSTMPPSTLQSIPPFKKALISNLKTGPLLERPNVNNQSSMEGELTPDPPKVSGLAQKLLNCEKSQQLEPCGLQDLEQSKEAAQSNSVSKDARSVSSDGPPPKDSLFKRFRDSFINSQ